MWLWQTCRDIYIRRRMNCSTQAQKAESDTALQCYTLISPNEVCLYISPQNTASLDFSNISIPQPKTRGWGCMEQWNQKLKTWHPQNYYLDPIDTLIFTKQQTAWGGCHGDVGRLGLVNGILILEGVRHPPVAAKSTSRSQGVKALQGLNQQTWLFSSTTDLDLAAGLDGNW